MVKLYDRNSSFNKVIRNSLHSLVKFGHQILDLSQNCATPLIAHYTLKEKRHGGITTGAQAELRWIA
jgi:hypothetical protein